MHFLFKLCTGFATLCQKLERRMNSGYARLLSFSLSKSLVFHEKRHFCPPASCSLLPFMLTWNYQIQGISKVIHSSYSSVAMKLPEFKTAFKEPPVAVYGR